MSCDKEGRKVIGSLGTPEKREALQSFFDVGSESSDYSDTVALTRSPETGELVSHKQAMKRKRRAERQYERTYGDLVPNPLHSRPPRKMHK